jgi:hypothetical protein
MSVRVHQARYLARCAACATPFVALLWSAPAASQGASQCLDSIPSGALTRLPVYLDVSTSPGAPQAFRTGLMFYTQAVARRLRSNFPMHGDTVGEGELAVMWRDVGKHVAMTVFRNGEMRGAIEGNSEEDRIRATEMLSRGALAASRSSPFWRRESSPYAWFPATASRLTPRKRDALAWPIGWCWRLSSTRAASQTWQRSRKSSLQTDGARASQPTTPSLWSRFVRGFRARGTRRVGSADAYTA